MATDTDGNDIALSKRQVKRAMREHSERISDDAAIVMALQLERKLHKKTRAAKLSANLNGRKTVKEEDVRLVGNVMDIMEGED